MGPEEQRLRIREGKGNNVDEGDVRSKRTGCDEDTYSNCLLSTCVLRDICDKDVISSLREVTGLFFAIHSLHLFYFYYFFFT